ncbi:MAG: hypothetical protein M3463_12535, partial [Verrucomicrobiota bacterium]|nr:hypothetical protein [Verrucomicrobiota bacterium]
ELLFAARNKEAITETRNALIVSAGSLMRDHRGERGNEPPLFHGQVPANYTVRQQLRQWTPQVNRITRFDAAADSAPIPWDLLESEVIAANNPAVAMQRLARRFPQFGFHIFGDKWPGAGVGPLAATESKVLKALCGPLSGGVYALLSRSSPSAGDLEDLALLDSSNPREWVLVVRRQNAGEVVFYRRLVDPHD